jgi:hypothetical protein
MKAFHLNKLSCPGASEAPHQSGASVWKSFNSYKQLKQKKHVEQHQPSANV